jgi:hypothetical protein
VPLATYAFAAALPKEAVVIGNKLQQGAAEKKKKVSINVRTLFGPKCLRRTIS